jgi:hypothetical protein
MRSKQFVRALMNKMPDDVTLGEVVSWVNTAEHAGADQAGELAADLEKDLADFFSKKRRAARRPGGANGAHAKKKVLHMLGKLPEGVGLGEILNRLVLLRKIEAGLEESGRGQGMDHDEFFRELCKETVHHGARLLPGDFRESE